LAVRASPISKTAAILITIVGLFVLLTGLIARVVTNEVEGAVFIILGLVLYGVLRRFTKKLRRELRGSPTSSQAAGQQ
jgi:membrane protein implicated in regulation of membrane protease activity